MTITQTADFSQNRNDLYWTIRAGPDGSIRWTGYDDGFWWDRVAVSEQFRTRIGAATGRKFTLDPNTDEVVITEGSTNGQP